MTFFENRYAYQGYFVQRFIRLDTITMVETMADSGGVAKVHVEHAGGKVSEICDRAIACEFMKQWTLFLAANSNVRETATQ